MKVKYWFMAFIAAVGVNAYAGVLPASSQAGLASGVTVNKLMKGMKETPAGSSVLTYQDAGVPLRQILRDPEVAPFIKGDYTALIATFTQPMESFNFSASSHSGDPFSVYLLDQNKAFIGEHYFKPTAKSPALNNNATRRFQYDYSLALDANVGALVFGSSFDPILIKSYDFVAAKVPEPSSAWLLSLGLIGFLAARRRNNTVAI